MTLSVPVDSAELNSFDRAVSALHTRAAMAAKESFSLSQLRDFLLPQLLSGRMRVRDAEKVVEEVV